MDKAEEFLSQSVSQEIKILTPIQDLTKREELLLFKQNNLPLDLIYSYQKGKSTMCQICPSCEELFDTIAYVYADEL